MGNHKTFSIEGRYVEMEMDLPCLLWLCLDCKLHDDVEFISDDQRMLSVLFSPSMTNGWYATSGFWSFLEVCMKPTCLEEFQWRLRTFSWRTTFCENVFLEMSLEFVLTRMSFLLANNNFQTALFQTGFCMWMVWEFCGEERLFSGLAFVDGWNAFATCANAC